MNPASYLTTGLAIHLSTSMDFKTTCGMTPEKHPLLRRATFKERGILRRCGVCVNLRRMELEREYYADGSAVENMLLHLSEKYLVRIYSERRVITVQLWDFNDPYKAQPIKSVRGRSLYLLLEGLAGFA